MQMYCLVIVCRWLLLLVAVNCVLLTPTNYAISLNTYIYSWAMMILGLWAGVLERLGLTSLSHSVNCSRLFYLRLIY